MDVGQPSIDQLRIFIAVAEEGSFARAGKRLGRAISVISYGISGLEAQLGVKLFARHGSRRPALTVEGQALLADARAVAGDIDSLIARTRGLQQGLEPELSLVLDVMIPAGCIAGILREFQSTFPTVPLRLNIEALGAVVAMVMEERASLGISGPAVAKSRGLDRRYLGSLELVPVAAPGHPLARMDAIAPGEARKHMQLVLTDRSPLTAGRDFAVLAVSSWRLADLGAKHALLREGIGWGNMPRHLVENDLATGRLARLTLPEGPPAPYGISALWRRDQPPGPAASWALERFAGVVGQQDLPMAE